MSDNSAARLSPEMTKILRTLFELSMPTLRGKSVADYAAILSTFRSPLIRWDESMFIGDAPSVSEINVLSRALRRLENRGLLRRYSKEMEPRTGKQHTGFVSLTATGIKAVAGVLMTEAELKAAQKRHWQEVLDDHPMFLRDVALALEKVSQDETYGPRAELVRDLLETTAKLFEVLNPNINHLEPKNGPK